MSFVEALELRRLFTVYYLSPTGNDANPGGDPTQPWRTIAKIDATSFSAGDSILFQAGQSFGGNLKFGADDAGNASLPITIDTYGVDPTSGTVIVGGAKATINAGNGNGFLASNTAGIGLRDLALVGSGQADNSFNGIQFDNSLAGNVQLAYVNIDSVSVSGFGKFGITIGGSNGKSGFSNVGITNSEVFNNVVGGIETHGVFSSSTATAYANSAVYLGHDTVHDNPGYAGSSNHVGDGIVLSDVNGATVERCESYNNGARNTHNGGPVGIWTWDGNAVTIQYNESYNNHTAGSADGGGFDLDGGSTNCVLQYNYSHGNDGAGFGAFQFSGARPFGNNVIRDNVSENDARKNGYGAITLWGYSSTALQNLAVYNNTVYLTQNSTGSRALYLESGTKNVSIRNNIFDVSGGAQLVYVSGTQTNLLVQGNDYWTSGSAFNIKYGNKTYSTLSAFRSGAKQELLNGAAAGMNVNPLLTAPGAGGTVGNADQLATLTAYVLQSSSPLIGAGLNLTSLGTDPGTSDFFGNPVPDVYGRYGIGADQHS
jgi:hypothetical protein